MSQDPLIFNGRKYISSRRAASISGYTSDYIGQLARSKKISSRMVGRNRFIDEAELLEYVYSTDTNHESLQNEEDKFFESSADNTSAEVGDVSDSSGLSQLSNLDTDFANSVISPKRESQSVRRNKDFSDSIKSKQISFASALVVVILLGVFLNIGPGRDGLSLFVQSFEGSENRNMNVEVASISASGVKEVLVKVDDEFIGFLSRVDAKVIMLTQAARDKFLSLFAKDEEVYVADKENVETPIANDTPNTLQVEIDEEKLRQYVREIMLNEQDVFAPGRSYDGIVTLPSTGDANRDRQIIEDVKNSFSDEVTVEIDSSGTSGVIRPVFRDKSDLNEAYMFLLVPVN